MTDEPPQSRPESRRLPDEKKSRTGRGFPMIAPLLVVVVALILMAIFWLAR